MSLPSNFGVLSDSAVNAISYACDLRWPSEYQESSVSMESSIAESALTTEAILLGLCHSSDDDGGPVNELLQVFGLSDTQLLEAVNEERKSRGLTEVRDIVGDRRALTGLPPLSRNVAALFDNAGLLSRQYNAEEGQMRPADLFGGLLRTPDSIAYRALARVLDSSPIPLDKIVQTYEQFLQVSRDLNYRDLLERLFPNLPSPSQEDSPTAPSASSSTEDQKPPPPPQWDTAVSRANRDAPTSIDKLGFAPLTKGLAATVTHEQTELPMAIGITAPWGAASPH